MFNQEVTPTAFRSFAGESVNSFSFPEIRVSSGQLSGFRLVGLRPSGSDPCPSVSIYSQVVRTRINKGFLKRMDGHCQRKSQQCGECLNNSPQLAGTR
jgi:hypothetical protein